MKIFGSEKIFVIADNCDDDLIQFINTYRQKCQAVFITRFGNGCDSFKFAVNTVFDMKVKGNITNDDIVYLVEDDYIHRQGSVKVIIDGLTYCDYLTLYDHPDKYVNANSVNENGTHGNPFISDLSESSRVYVGTQCHFKLTNSTTMTFATRVQTLYTDWDIMMPFLTSTFPYDFEMFTELQKHKKKLGSPIPSYSTHCETNYLAPLIDWEKEL